MSIQVSLDDLPDVLPAWGACFVVTVADDGQARAVRLHPKIDGSSLIFDHPGRSALINVEERPTVTLLFAPHTGSDGLSLIVDGDAAVGDDRLIVVPTNAVLHRPAP